jgi:transglutaminase-like putative cysteine protease
MRVICTTFCLLMLITFANAQADYNASLIPKDLLPYASAVIRNKDVTIEVKDADNTIYHIKTAITILNKNGDDIARIVIWHNRSNTIRYVKGTLYNEFGQPTGKFAEKDFTDVNAASDMSLFEDSRVKHYTPSTGSYPYTIEYEYEQRSKQSLNFDDWQPNKAVGLAVEKSSFTFICKPDFNIRYKEVNLPPSVITGTTKDGLKTYTWQVTNLKAIKDEPYSPNRDKYLSTVKIAPENFKYEGISGTFTNWKELGKWNYDKLLVNRQALPAATVQQISTITNGITSPKLKAKKIYEYMQNKTRYISVQIGIGGYQPFLASEVDRLNYGDCKALVNYTQALLKTADIESWYCVVEAGARKVSLLNDFASMSQGNHIILCLPFKNDTTFLECTSQKIPFGFLSDFTDDRTVLACTPEGGKLMHTPKYTAQINSQVRKAGFTVDKNGVLTGDVTTTFKGTQYDNHEDLLDESMNEQVKILQKRYNAINNLDIEKCNYQQEKNELPAATETIKLSARDFATTENGKLYFSINPLNRSIKTVRDVRNRANPVYINSGYTDEDEITYTLPAGYHSDLNPLNVSVEKPFGKFKATMVLNGDKLTFKRTLQVIDGTYSKETYHELVEFYQTVVDADNYNVTLVKN